MNKKSLRTLLSESSDGELESLRSDPARRYEYVQLLRMLIANLQPGEKPLSYVMFLHELARALAGWEEGDVESHQEEALEVWDSATRYCGRLERPDLFYVIQLERADLFSRRRAGSLSSNLEEALRCLQLALEGCAPDRDYDRAQVLLRQGQTLVSLCQTGRDTSEEACSRLRQAVELFDVEAHPYEAAAARAALGAALSLGDAPPDAAYEEALRVMGEAAALMEKLERPHEQARVVVSQALAWLSRPEGDPDEKAERALECFQLYRQLLPPGVMGDEEAVLTLRREGDLWRERRRGEEDENLAQARVCFEAALARVSEHDPMQLHRGLCHRLFVVDLLRAAAGREATTLVSAQGWLERSLEGVTPEVQEILPAVDELAGLLWRDDGDQTARNTWIQQRLEQLLTRSTGEPLRWVVPRLVMRAAWYRGEMGRASQWVAEIPPLREPALGTPLDMGLRSLPMEWDEQALHLCAHARAGHPERLIAAVEDLPPGQEGEGLERARRLAGGMALPLVYVVSCGLGCLSVWVPPGEGAPLVFFEAGPVSADLLVDDLEGGSLGEFLPLPGPARDRKVLEALIPLARPEGLDSLLALLTAQLQPQGASQAMVVPWGVAGVVAPLASVRGSPFLFGRSAAQLEALYLSPGGGDEDN